MNNLNELKADYERKIILLNEEKQELKKTLDELRYEGLEAMTRKQIDEVEKYMVATEMKYERNKDKLEKINTQLVNTKAGVEHMIERLSEIKVDIKLDKPGKQ